MESGEGNAKRGWGRWMEDCGRGAAVVQLTARGMEYQSPQWGAIDNQRQQRLQHRVSIPAMGGNSEQGVHLFRARESIPAMGGNSALSAECVGIVEINPRDGGQ